MLIQKFYYVNHNKKNLFKFFATFPLTVKDNTFLNLIQDKLLSIIQIPLGLTKKIIKLINNIKGKQVLFFFSTLLYIH